MKYQVAPEYRELFEQWADDLESGQFTQTKGVLIRTEEGTVSRRKGTEHVTEPAPPGHCCVGVLATRVAVRIEPDIHRYSTNAGMVEEDRGRLQVFWKEPHRYADATNAPIELVSEWFPGHRIAYFTLLYALNDYYEWPFPAIAQVIRRVFLGNQHYLGAVKRIAKEYGLRAPEKLIGLQI